MIIIAVISFSLSLPLYINPLSGPICNLSASFNYKEKEEN